MLLHVLGQALPAALQHTSLDVDNNTRTTWDLGFCYSICTTPLSVLRCAAAASIVSLASVGVRESQ